MASHLDQKMLLAYVSEQLSHEEQLQVDSHIADCTDCRERVRVLLYIRNNFGSLWPFWTATEHGRVYRQWQLVKALREVAETSPSLAQRAAQWAEQLAAGVETGLKVLVNHAKKVAITAAGAMPAGYEFQLRPAYVGVASEELMVLEDHLNKSSTFLSQDETDQALDELIEAVKIDARAAQVVLSEVYYKGNLHFQVAADSHRSIIWLKCWPLEGQEPPSLAALLPKGAVGPIPVVQFKPVEGERYLLAEFENVGDGTYSLAFGPVPEKRREV